MTEGHPIMLELQSAKVNEGLTVLAVLKTSEPEIIASLI